MFAFDPFEHFAARAAGEAPTQVELVRRQIGCAFVTEARLDEMGAERSAMAANATPFARFQWSHPFDAEVEAVENAIVTDSKHVLAAFAPRVTDIEKRLQEALDR